QPRAITRRVEDRDDVVLYETALVPRTSGPLAQPVLEWSQRANPTHPMHHHAPNGQRKMQPRRPRPSKRQQSARHDESDEREVNEDHRIGEQAKHDDSEAT